MGRFRTRATHATVILGGALWPAVVEQVTPVLLGDLLDHEVEWRLPIDRLPGTHQRRAGSVGQAGSASRPTVSSTGADA